MPTLTTMVRAGVAIRGGVTWPSVYTQRTWILVNQAQYAGNARFLGIQSLPTGSLGTRKVGFIPGSADENDLRVQYSTAHARGGAHRGV
jgi:hypothetical protein